MRTIILATVAVLGIGVGAAYAGDGEDGGTIPDTFFSELPGVQPTPTGTLPNNVAAQDRYGAPMPAYGAYGTDQSNTASATPHPTNCG
jgi:hypothetical protein